MDQFKVGDLLVLGSMADLPNGTMLFRVLRVLRGRRRTPTLDVVHVADYFDEKWCALPGPGGRGAYYSSQCCTSFVRLCRVENSELFNFVLAIG